MLDLVHAKGDLSWVFIGRTDAEAETPILWPPHAKSWLIGKDSDAGRDWGQEKGTTEDEMAGWHHQLNAHEFGWTPGVGDGQGGLACCDSWGRRESDTTEQLNWTEWHTWLHKSFLENKSKNIFLKREKNNCPRGFFIFYESPSFPPNTHIHKDTQPHPHSIFITRKHNYAP